MAAPSRSSVLDEYDAAPRRIREYFTHLPDLLEQGFPLDVALSYVFANVELAHNMALYCGAVKLHRANATLARRAINTHHMTRADFRKKFETVYGEPIPDEIVAELASAETVRDKVMHGKSPAEADKRQALVAVLRYAEAFNKFSASVGGVRPFGDLRGFKGRSQALDTSTTRWVLKGMGFALD